MANKINGQYQQIAEELLAMREVDQKMRYRYEALGENPTEWDYSIDEKNTKRLKEIIREIGWPTISKVGHEASDAAWILAQHADYDPDFQAKCLKLMKDAGEKEVSKKFIAYLEDRVRISKGLPQIFGTQFRKLEDGTYGPCPIEDIEHLNERRGAFGLEPFEE